MIYQPAFEVPAEIAVKVAAGEYILWGGVVRDTAGRIVKHLKPVELQKTSEAALSVGQRVIRFAKANPVLVAVGATALAVGGIYAYVKFAAAPAADGDEIDSSGLNHALSSYIEALQAGNLNVSVVDNLLVEIDKLEAMAGSGRVTIEFDSSQLRTLVSSVRAYTEDLIRGNAEILSGIDVPLPTEHNRSLSGLKECLLVQKTVLEAA